MAAQAGQLELNVMMPVMAHNLLMSAEILKNAVKVFREKCVSGIAVNYARCQEYIDKSLGIATALNQYIGYLKAAEVAKEALKTGKSVAQDNAREGLPIRRGVQKVFDPMRLTEPS